MTKILRKCQDVLKRFDSIYETYLYEEGDRTALNIDEIVLLQSLHDEIWQFSYGKVASKYWDMLSTTCLAFDRLTDALHEPTQDFTSIINAMSNLSDLYSMIKDF